MIEFRIVEIFESLQGEGYNTGMPAIFIRFAGCNLNCTWCDTNFRRFSRFSLEALRLKINSYQSRNIIITGGEPTQVRFLSLLLTQLKEEGYFIAIESNGLCKVDAQIDYIALSPKYCYRDRYKKAVQTSADEVRIVVEPDEEMIDFCRHIETQIAAKRYFLSPCEQEGKFNMRQTLYLLGELNQGRTDNKWLLSFQTHKLAGID